MSLHFIAALPGLTSRQSVQGGRFLFLHPDDARYKGVCDADRGIEGYLASFSTPFGNQLRPPVVAVEQARKRPVPATDLAMFRDCIAIAAIIDARRRSDGARPSGFDHSDSFEFYPVHPGRDDDSVYLHTASERGVHELAQFRGQPNPVVLHPYHRHLDFDQALLTPLLQLFARKRARRDLWIRVSRALHAAFLACQAPFLHLGGQLDLGMTTSLWVTAFEVLVHPGGSDDVRFDHVKQALLSIPWPEKALRRQSRVAVDTRKKEKRTRPLAEPHTTPPVQLYGRLYAARNAYLHGDPEYAKVQRHLFHGRRGSLQVQAPILFRFLLLRELAHVGLYSFPRVPSWRDPMPADKKARYSAEFKRWLPEREVARHLLRRRSSPED